MTEKGIASGWLSLVASLGTQKDLSTAVVIDAPKLFAIHLGLLCLGSVVASLLFVWACNWIGAFTRMECRAGRRGYRHWRALRADQPVRRAESK